MKLLNDLTIDHLILLISIGHNGVFGVFYTIPSDDKELTFSKICSHNLENVGNTSGYYVFYPQVCM
jgi:hypothetical protein